MGHGTARSLSLSLSLAHTREDAERGQEERESFHVTKKLLRAAAAAAIVAGLY
jgi:hypothetical protein